MSDILESLQWPAMAASLLAAWPVGSRTAARRCAGLRVLWISSARHRQERAGVTSLPLGYCQY